MLLKHAAVVSAVMVVSLAACASAGGEDGSVGGPPSALTVAEALQAGEGQKVRVRGAVVVDRSEARMCDGLAESYAPQCLGGARLLDFDVSGLPSGTQQHQGIRWAESVELIAKVEGGDTLRQVRGGKTE